MTSLFGMSLVGFSILANAAAIVGAAIIFSPRPARARRRAK